MNVEVIDEIRPADLAESAHIPVPMQHARCPWCQEWVNVDAVLYGSTEDKYPTFRVHCSSCGGAGPIAHTPKLAWKLWNKRAMAPKTNGVH